MAQAMAARLDLLEMLQAEAAVTMADPVVGMVAVADTAVADMAMVADTTVDTAMADITAATATTTMVMAMAAMDIPILRGDSVSDLAFRTSHLDSVIHIMDMTMDMDILT